MLLRADHLGRKACSLDRQSPAHIRHVAVRQKLWSIRKQQQQQLCQRHTTVRIFAVAAEAPEATADKKRRGRPVGTQKKDPEISEQGMLDLPVATDYQQTLKRSFTMGGTGLHTGEYAVVRVRPAYAGEGRYFVRVPKGTNEAMFDMFGEPLELTEEDIEVAADEEIDPELEKAKVALYMEYLRAQEEQQYPGTFEEWVFELSEWDLPYKKEMMTGVSEEEVMGEGEEDDEEEDEEEDVLEDITPLDEEDPTLMRAHISNVKVVGMPYSQLGDEEEEGRVLGMEFLLAALEACGVDDARIEVEGGHEIPVLDHSALGWCLEVQQSGMRAAPFNPDSPEAQEADEETLASRPAYKPSKPLMVQAGDTFVSFAPGDFAKLTAGVDHQDEAPIIGQQWYSWRYTQDLHFRYEVAPARGYAASVNEIFSLRSDGFLKAGAENLFVIGHGERWYDPEVVRFFNDEPARHKIVQLVGDLALLAPPGGMGIPTGHIIAFQADHALHAEFMRTLLVQLGEEEEESQGLTTSEAIIDTQQEILESGYEAALAALPPEQLAVAREGLGTRGFMR